jgi:hypothetical protein
MFNFNQHYQYDSHLTSEVQFTLAVFNVGSGNFNIAAVNFILEKPRIQKEAAQTAPS